MAGPRQPWKAQRPRDGEHHPEATQQARVPDPCFWTPCGPLLGRVSDRTEFPFTGGETEALTAKPPVPSPSSPCCPLPVRIPSTYSKNQVLFSEF
jgi:hypothetical protein